jgi:hypothetical protein
VDIQAWIVNRPTFSIIDIATWTIKSTRPIDHAWPAAQIDLAPTVLALGIDPAPLPYLGRNLLAAPEDGPLPRPYGDWLDASHLFLARGAASICYDVVRRDVRILADCSRANAAARRMRDLSRSIIVDDLQKPTRERLSSAIH